MTAAGRILVLNGPNLNMLGRREPEIYGHETLDDIRAQCAAHAASLGVEIDFRQSNSESEIVGWIQQSIGADSGQDRGQEVGRTDGIVINPAAFTHTSVAIMDALKLTELPVVEIHLSNIFRREDFRRHSYISGVARGIISGFGSHGYLLALEAMVRLIAPGKGN